MLDTVRKQSPVIVTATGGSGTRVIATILEGLGCYMGGNLNYAKDNMDFAYCLSGNIPEVNEAFPFDGDISFFLNRLALFDKCFFQERFTVKDYGDLLRIGFGFTRSNKRWAISTRPARDRIENLLKVFRVFRPTPMPEDTLLWGVKDPDAMFLLKPLAERYPDLKIIHIVRDGRDMAVSTQQKSMMYYGPLFGLPREYNPGASFDFWSRSNMWFRQACAQTLPKLSYCLVQFETLCRNPKSEIDRLAAFLGGRQPTDSIYAIPKVISSIGRWKKQPELFTSIDQAALQQFGYLDPLAF